MVADVKPEHSSGDENPDGHWRKWYYSA